MSIVNELSILAGELTRKDFRWPLSGLRRTMSQFFLGSANKGGLVNTIGIGQGHAILVIGPRIR
jgi:hypothetical protein